MGVEKFQIHGVKISRKTFVSQQIESVHFCSCPQAKPFQVLIINTLGRGKLPISLKQPYFLFSRKEVNYRAETMIKIKPARVLVTKFDKFHHFCNL